MGDPEVAKCHRDAGLEKDRCVATMKRAEPGVVEGEKGEKR